MEIIKKKTVKITITKGELIYILGKHFVDEGVISSKSKITLREKTKTETIPGGDLHDCEYVTHFDGVELNIEDNEE